MNRYRTSGFRSVKAESMKEAAEIFATRAARKKYGKRGHARTCTMGLHSRDGRLAEFQAFIGYPAGERKTATEGHNIHFTVSEEAVGV